MLSFSKVCCHLKDLRCLFSLKSSPVMSVDCRELNFRNHLLQIKFYSSATNYDEVIPLEEISNLSTTHKNFSAEELSLLVTQISRHKSYGKGLPKYIKLIDVRDILECETPSQRSKYLVYLFKKEKVKQKSKEKKLMNKPKDKDEHIEVSKGNDHIQYGLGKNTLFLRSLKRNIMRYYEKRLANATLFGQKMVIDLGYDKLMTKKEKKACISQIRLLYSFNRLSRDPYDLHLCNAGSDNRCVEYLRYEMPNVDESFVTLTEQSYLDIFPKESLVYLSPHASEVLTSYDSKAVYIIGGFVDTVKREHVSSFKAQEEGIKSYRLPLDEFVAWGIGSKSLTLNQVFSILQTKRDTGDWREAFKHLPVRKIRKIDVDTETAALYSDKLYAVNNN